MEAQVIKIGKVRFVQDNEWYIIEEKPETTAWEEIARFKMGVDAINYLKNYFDEVIDELKKSNN